LRTLGEIAKEEMSGRQPPRVYDSNSPGWRTTCPERIDNVACANARAKFKLTHYANDRLEAPGSRYVSGRTRAWLKTNTEVRAAVINLVSFGIAACC
jgi:hypothetical protein